MCARRRAGRWGLGAGRNPVPDSLDAEMIRDAAHLFERGEKMQLTYTVRNTARAIGARTSSHIVRKFGMRNDLQPAALELYPELATTLAAGLSAGALSAIVCGSGPTCAFLCADADQADRLAVEVASAPEVRGTRRAHGPVPGPEVL